MRMQRTKIIVIGHEMISAHVFSLCSVKIFFYFIAIKLSLSEEFPQCLQLCGQSVDDDDRVSNKLELNNNFPAFAVRVKKLTFLMFIFLFLPTSFCQHQCCKVQHA